MNKLRHHRKTAALARAIAATAFGAGIVPAFVHASAPPPTTFTWTGAGANANWTTNGNWDLPGFPSGTANSATIGAAGSVNLNVNITVDDLNLNFATVYGSSGTTLSSQLMLNITSALTLDSITLVNNGTGVWAAGDINVYYAPTFQTTGSLDIQSDNNLYLYAGSAATFVNTGTVTKSSGIGTSTIAADLNNSGTITANSGTLYFQGYTAASISTGSFVSNAGTIRLAYQFLDTGASFSGTGTSELAAYNTVSGNASTAAGATVKIIGDNNSITGDMNIASTAVLELATSGGLRGTGTISGAGQFKWSDGYLYGNDIDAGSLVSSAPMLITGPAIKSLYTGRFTNAASSVWDDGTIYTYYAPTFNNSGTLDVQGDNLMTPVAGNAALFANSGTLIKSAGMGTSTIQADLANSGTVQADSGTLFLQGYTAASVSTGSFVSNGGTVRLANQFLDTGASFSGTGTSELSASNTVSGNASIAAGGSVKIVGDNNSITGDMSIASTGAFELGGGGGLRGTGTISGAGQFKWSEGTLYGNDIDAGSLVSSAPMLITGPSLKSLYAGRFTNAANSVWDDGYIFTYYAPTFSNSGTLDLQGDVYLTPAGGNAALISNAGTLIKSAGMGISTIQADLANSGTVQADSGTLFLQGYTAASVSTGSFVSNGGTVRLSNQILGTGASFSGAGTSELAAGNIVSGNASVSAGGSVKIIGDNNSITGTMSIASTAALELGSGGGLRGTGSISGAGQFKWSDGYLYGNDIDAGSLVSSAPMLITGPAVKFLYSGRFTNDGNSIWDEGNIYTYYAPTFSNTGSLDLRDDVLMTPAAGNPALFDNSGTLKKTAGAGIATIQADLVNTGTIRANIGVLELIGYTAASQSNGSFVSNGMGTVRLNKQTLTTGAFFSGTGTGELGANNVIAGDADVGNSSALKVVGVNNAVNGQISIGDMAQFELATSGELRGTGSIGGSGTFKFSGGTLIGNDVDAGSLVSNAPMLITGPTVKSLSTGRFTNANNDSIWEDGDIYSYYAPNFINTGTLDLRSDNSIYFVAGSVGTFDNSGTFKKTLATGSSTIDIVINNTGTVEADSGTMSFTRNFTSTGTFTVAPGATVNFSGTTTNLGGVQNWPAGYSLTMNNDLNLNSDAGYAGPKLTLVQNSATLTIASTQHLEGLTINTTSAPAAVTGGVDKVIVTDNLSMGTNARLDLNDNNLIVRADDVTHFAEYAATEALVKSGFGNFDWLGSGITSALAAAQAQIDGSLAVGVIDNTDWGHGDIEGEAVGANDIIVKYTWVADANCDGLVDNDDFGQFLYGFNGGGSPVWLNGDFDYNGVVDNDDFGWFLTGLSAFQASGNMQLSESFKSQLAAFASEQGIPLVLDPTPVPEPASAAALGVIATGILTRRRRN